jgi:hypothetical protein
MESLLFHSLDSRHAGQRFDDGSMTRLQAKCDALARSNEGKQP